MSIGKVRKRPTSTSRDFGYLVATTLRWSWWLVIRMISTLGWRWFFHAKSNIGRSVWSRQERLVPSAVRRRNGSTAVEIDIKKIPRDMGKASRTYVDHMPVPHAGRGDHRNHGPCSSGLAADTASTDFANELCQVGSSCCKLFPLHACCSAAAAGLLLSRSRTWIEQCLASVVSFWQD